MEGMEGWCVLLVEDNDDNREVYETILRYFNFRVLTAVNGLDGIQKAAASSPDLILMDIQMPVMDGLSAARRLKECPGTSGIPIVMLTAHIRDEDRIAAAAIGCEGFLLKPCAPRDVVAEVSRVCASRAGPALVS